MNPSNRKSKILWVSVGLAVVLAAGVVWLFYPVQEDVSASGRGRFVVEADYHKVRAILVRRDATRAIVEHSGVELLDDRIAAFEL